MKVQKVYQAVEQMKQSGSGDLLDHIDEVRECAKAMLATNEYLIDFDYWDTCVAGGYGFDINVFHWGEGDDEVVMVTAYPLNIDASGYWSTDTTFFVQVLELDLATGQVTEKGEA